MHFLVMPSLFSRLGSLMGLPAWGQNVGILFLNALCSIWIYRRFLLLSWKNARNPLKILTVTVLGLMLYYAVSALYTGFANAVSPGYSNLNDTQVAALLKDGGVWMLLSVVIAAPIGEECIFRGLLFRGLYDRSPIAAWCVCVGLFAAIHVIGYIGLYQPAALILAFFQYIPAGLLLCLVYRLSHSFLCPVLLHICINSIGLLLI